MLADLRAEHQRAVDLAVKGRLTEAEFATAKADRNARSPRRPIGSPRWTQ
jgi:hypothetical protein